MPLTHLFREWRQSVEAMQAEAAHGPHTPEKRRKESALDTQIGGGHYKDMAIQPAEYSQRNRLGFLEGMVVKYVSRHRAKNGAEDLRKAKHCIDLILELEYPEGT